MSSPIGQIKAKATVNCTICNKSYNRSVNEYFYENTIEDKERVKRVIIDKIQKPFTCTICKSILKSQKA